jgi:hypothetical protein
VPALLIISLGLHFRRVMIGLNDVLFFAKWKTDKSKRDQDGSAYHQPMRILHCGESVQLVRLTCSPSVANLNQFG